MIVLKNFATGDFCVDTLAGAFVIMAIVLMIASEVAVPVSYATFVRTGAMIDVLTGMVFSVVTDNGTNVSADTGLSM